MNANARLQAARYRFCAAMVVCWLASGTTARGESYFSFQGNFTTPSGAFQDFRFRPLEDFNYLYLRTYAWSGGSNLAGEVIAGGGIDSTLALYAVGFPIEIAFNDDIVGGNDSLLWWGGSGSSYLEPQPSGNYRLQLANFGSSIGDGHWAADLYNIGSMSITPFASSNSTLTSLTFGTNSSALASFDWSSGDLWLTQHLTVRENGELNLSGGSITAGRVYADAGDINVSNGADMSVAAFNLKSGGQATFDGPGTTLTANAGYLGTFGLPSSLVFQNGATGTFSHIFLPGDFQFATEVLFSVQSGATVVVGNFIWTLGAEGAYASVFVGGLGSSLTVTGTSPMRIGDGNAGGRLLVTSGATYSAPNAPVHLGPGGSVVIGGGHVTLGEVFQEGGDMIFNTGTLSYLGDLVVGAGGLLGSDLTLPAERHLTLSGTTTVDALRTLTLDGGTLNTGSLTVNGTMNFTSGTLDNTSGGVLPVEGHGLIQVGSSINAPVVGSSPALTIRVIASGVSLGDAASFSGFSHEGTLDVGANSITLNSAGYARLGILTTLGGGTINAPNGVAFATGSNFLGRGAVNARVSGDAGSVIAASGALSLGDAASPAGFFSYGELVVNEHTVTLLDANQAVLGSLTKLGRAGQPGTLAAANGAVVEFGKNIVGHGTVDTPNDPTRPLINNGAIEGESAARRITLTGYVKGVGTFDDVVFTGTFSPGFSPAKVYLGSAAYDPGGTLEIELGGTMPGSGHDQLIHSGTASLAGTLALSLINGHVPAIGDQYQIATWANRTGTFGAITGQNPAPGVLLSAVYRANDLILMTTLQGEKTWGVDASGLSSVGSNWIGGVAPSGVGDTAAFTTIVTANRQVTINVPTTVGTLRFDDNNNYTLAGPGPLTLQGTGAGHAAILVQNAHGNGAHVISTPLVLNSALDVTQNSSGNFTLSGGLNNSAGRTITKSGDGTLTLSGPQNHGVGATLNVQTGIVNLNSNTGTPAASPAVARLMVNVTGGTLIITTDQDLKALEVDESSGKAVINYQTNLERKVRIYDSGTTTGAVVNQSAIDAAWLDITTGYNGGTWNGLGIGTPFIGDANVNGLGLVREVDLNGAEFLGIREMILGDVNGDDFVDAADASVLFSNIGTDGTWLTGDLNYDSFIDAGDATVIFGALGQSFDPGFAPAAVPEPGTLMLMVIGLVALASNRRRRDDLR